MPRPSTTQASTSEIGPCAPASSTSPAGSTSAEATSTRRPPRPSMCRPIAGPTTAISTSAIENAPNTQERDRPSVSAIGSASTAGR